MNDCCFAKDHNGYNEAMKISALDEIDALMKEYDAHPLVQRMRLFYQHGHVNTYMHARRVMRKSLAIKRALHIHVDEKELLLAALLHDFYLYDWHEVGDGSHHFHGFRHPKRASEKAIEVFCVSPLVAKAIRTHMWPLTLFHIPTSKIGWIICIADKLISIKETILRR